MLRLRRIRSKATQASGRPVRDWFDFVTLAIETLGFGAVIVTIIITMQSGASNDAVMANALKRMRDIAEAMNRQAVEMGQQRPYVQRQADAAADAARAAMDSASAAKGQTGAIVKQANALIASANATVIASGAQLESAQANIKTAEAGGRAADQQLRSATLLATTRAPFAKLRTVAIGGWTSLPQNGVVKITIKPSFINVGGGALFHRQTTFNFLVTDSISPTPPIRAQQVFGGNDLSIMPGEDYWPNKPFEYEVSVVDVEEVTKGSKGIIIWGRTDYADTGGTPYSMCYLDLVKAPTVDDAGGMVTSINSAGYQCPTQKIDALHFDR